MKLETVENNSCLISDRQLLQFRNRQHQDGARFLSFALTSEVDGLLPLGDLQGVIKVTLPDILPVPQVNQFLLGIINCQGEAAWILDLGGLLGMTHWCHRQTVPESGMAMLIKVESQTVGLLVEQVKAIENYACESCVPISPGMFPERLQRFLQGYFLDERDNPSILLNIEAVIQALHL